MKPEFIKARNKGPFTLRSITKRLPYIIEQVIANNQLDTEKRCRLEKLRAEIPDEKLKMVEFRDADYEYWRGFLNGHTGNWLEEPFYVVEFYMYRRIAEAVDFFISGFDPFDYTKRDLLHGKTNEITAIIRNLSQKRRPFKELLLYNLWGNRADLSQFNQPESYFGSSEKNIIINDIDRVCGLFDKKLGQVDVFLDNSGLELALDLLLVQYLLDEKAAERIYLHAKRYPIFVSDVMPADVKHTVDYFRQSGEPILKGFGEKLASAIGDGSIIVQTDPFWTLPEPFENFPFGIKEHLKRSDLVISKGDLNYRRLVEDRLWPYDTDVRDVIGYFPANILTMRSLKSELMLGVTEDEARRLFEEDQDWLVNGKYGMIQLVMKE